MLKLTVLVVICLVARASATACASANDASNCPALVCKEAGCDLSQNCVYANKQCNTCPNAAGTRADFVFIIDDSGSMSDNINDVSTGLQAFVDDLAANSIDARFAIVLENADAELVLSFTADGTKTKNKFVQIAGSVGGYHEAGFECIRIVLFEAVKNTLRRTGPDASGGDEDAIGWRIDALWVIILITDEDCDYPWYSQNQQPGQPSTPRQDPDKQINVIWQAETQKTADAILKHDVQLHMLVNPAEGGGSVATVYQYGDPALQSTWADFSHFNAAITLGNLLLQLKHKSIQGLLLAVGHVARVFDIRDVSDPNFVKNFFQEIVNNVRLCDACVISVCEANTAPSPAPIDICVERGLCDDGDGCTEDVCGANGDYGQCDFQPIVCPVGPDACNPFKCYDLTPSGVPNDGVAEPSLLGKWYSCVNPASVIPVTCTQIAKKPCSEFTCNPTTGVCEEGDRVCPETEDGKTICFEDYCKKNVGCTTKKNNTKEAKELCGGGKGKKISEPPAEPDETSKNAAIAGGVLGALVIIGIIAVLIAVWKIKSLKSDIAQLDAFQTGNDICDNALYKGNKQGGTNPLYDK